MGLLNVTTYQIAAARSRTNANSPRFVLTLRGITENGPVTEAAIFFYQTPQPGTIGSVSAQLLVGILPDLDFASWYDILRNERPVKVNYVEGVGGDARIGELSIGTNQEPVGEGPQDLTPYLKGLLGS
jgi:hypothetical protein